MAIPKLIHQTTTSRDTLTEPFKANLQTMKDLHPGWTFAFYDGAGRLDFIRKHFDKEMVRTYLSINPKYAQPVPICSDIYCFINVAVFTST
ncbi:MAG: hypothetical protein SFW65_09320 [Alphaproteobacteria bacterium]|nr:hypothetical protein [Alphaproteobacteria bacterium]